MARPTEKFDHPDHWEQGRRDGSEFNAIPQPDQRAGSALLAYLAGYEFGENCMAEYYNWQEDTI